MADGGARHRILVLRDLMISFEIKSKDDALPFLRLFMALSNSSLVNGLLRVESPN